MSPKVHMLGEGLHSVFIVVLKMCKFIGKIFIFGPLLTVTKDTVCDSGNGELHKDMVTTLKKTRQICCYNLPAVKLSCLCLQMP